ncbi:MAG: hypothetical protein R8G60_03395 [Roseovarius pacificus]|nr:hypothetical protein [Roseovarius pacificus]
MFEAEREGLLEDLETEPDARARVLMEEDLRQVDRVLEIIEQLLEKIGY